MNNALPDEGSQATLARFLERIRKSFSHDLRTPLSTIVNYASVLEAMNGERADEIRDLGQRIRSNALRASRMIQLLATSTGLASRPLHATATDLVALARSVIVDSGGRGEVHLATEFPGVVRVDAEVVGFAWRAFVAVESDAGPEPVHTLDLEFESSSQDFVAELRHGKPARQSGTRGEAATEEIDGYLRHNGGNARMETSMALSLAKELVVAHGGELSAAGRPAAGSVLRLRLPRSA